MSLQEQNAELLKDSSNFVQIFIRNYDADWIKPFEDKEIDRINSNLKSSQINVNDLAILKQITLKSNSEFALNLLFKVLLNRNIEHRFHMYVLYILLSLSNKYIESIQNAVNNYVNMHEALEKSMQKVIDRIQGKKGFKRKRIPQPKNKRLKMTSEFDVVLDLFMNRLQTIPNQLYKSAIMQAVKNPSVKEKLLLIINQAKQQEGINASMEATAEDEESDMEIEVAPVEEQIVIVPDIKPMEIGSNIIEAEEIKQEYDNTSMDVLDKTLKRLLKQSMKLVFVFNNKVYRNDDLILSAIGGNVDALIEWIYYEYMHSSTQEYETLLEKILRRNSNHKLVIMLPDFSNELLLSSIRSQSNIHQAVMIIDHYLHNRKFQIAALEQCLHYSIDASEEIRSVAIEYLTALKQQAAINIICEFATSQLESIGEYNCELFFKLLLSNHSLIQHVFRIYSQLDSEKQVFIRKEIHPIIKQLSSYDALYAAMISHPECDSLIIRALVILTESTHATKDLVETVKTCYSKTRDSRLLVPVFSGFDKNDMQTYMQQIVNLLDGSEAPKVIVSKVFSRIKDASITDADILVWIHRLDPSYLKKAILAIDLWFEIAGDNVNVIAGGLSRLLDIQPLPPLMMRTVITAYNRNNGLGKYILSTLLPKLFLKLAWENNIVWQGALKCIKMLVPDSYKVLDLIPSTILKGVLKDAPTLKQGYKEWKKGEGIKDGEKEIE